jgi:hypothetical protein
MNNKEKLYLAKIAQVDYGIEAGAMGGHDAGRWGTGAETTVGAASGATAGLGPGFPLPVKHTRALRQNAESLARLTRMQKIEPNSKALNKGVTRFEGFKKDLDKKVPDYMRTKHTGIPKLKGFPDILESFRSSIGKGLRNSKKGA